MSAEQGKDKAAAGRPRRKPLRATPEALERSALYYLERYDASSGHLRRVMRRKIALSARIHGTDPKEGAAALERLIEKLKGLGFLDDSRYAKERVRSLRNRGTSTAMIRAKLRAKALPAEMIEAALGDDSSGEGPAGESRRELRAALRYARRRRLGPYRLKEREERRDRDLAALARQGFDFETARKVIDSEDPAALEAGLEAE